MSAELHETLHRAIGTRGGLFHPTVARLGLYHLAMDQRSLEGYYRRAFVESFRIIADHLAMLNGLTRDKIIGPSGSAVSNLFLALPALEECVLNGRRTTENELLPLNQAIDNAIELLAAETHEDLIQLRTAAAVRVEGLTDRLLKTRALADEAITKSLTCEASDRNEWLCEAINQYSELLDQPVGSRDPMTWLLMGWARMRRDGVREEVVRAFHQACLTASGLQDQVHQEAHRHLAMAQGERGESDAAIQSVQKAMGDQPSALLMVEGVRYASMAGRLDDAYAIWERALAKDPFAILALIECKDLILHAPRFSQFAQESETKERKAARAALGQFQRHKEETERLIEEEGLDVSLPASVTAQLDFYKDQIRAASAPAARWIANESRRLGAEIHQVVTKQLERRLLACRNERQHAQGELESTKKLKDRVILGLEQQCQAEITAERARLGLDGSDRTPSASGCATSGGISAGAFTVYFVLSALADGFAARFGPNTSIGAFLMLALALPAAMGALHVLSRSSQQWNAERSLESQARSLDASVKQQIANIENDFRAKQQHYLDRIEELRVKEDEAAARLSVHQKGLNQDYPAAA